MCWSSCTYSVFVFDMGRENMHLMLLPAALGEALSVRVVVWGGWVNRSYWRTGPHDTQTEQSRNSWSMTTKEVSYASKFCKTRNGITAEPLRASYSLTSYKPSCEGGFPQSSRARGEARITSNNHQRVWKMLEICKKKNIIRWEKLRPALCYCNKNMKLW